MPALLQTVLLFALAPLVNGVIKAAKARWQLRLGPPIWQPYYDLAKLFRKQTLRATPTSWVFAAAPFVCWGTALVAASFVPVVGTFRPLIGDYDLFTFLYLLALGRFALILAGLDTGSAFGSMGASRTAMVAAFAEPALCTVLLAASLPGGSPVLGQIAGRAGSAALLLSPGLWLAAAVFLSLCIVETGRVPFDNPDTHLELTMIHEGILLEYSGPRLALLQWTGLVQQLVFLTLLANLFFPWGLVAPGANWVAVGLALGLYHAKVLLLGLTLAGVESLLGKMRLLRIPGVLTAAWALALIALGFSLAGYISEGM